MTTMCKGALILDIKDLSDALKENGVDGLLFEFNPKKSGADLDLKVFRAAIVDGDIIQENEIYLSSKTAHSLDRPKCTSASIRDYQYRYLEHHSAPDNLFEFGFESKANFQLLFKRGGDKLFLTGTPYEYNSNFYFDLKLVVDENDDFSDQRLISFVEKTIAFIPSPQEVKLLENKAIISSILWVAKGDNVRSKGGFQSMNLKPCPPHWDDSHDAKWQKITEIEFTEMTEIHI